MQCSICQQPFTVIPPHCPVCGYPIQKLKDVCEKEIRQETHTKAIDFYQKKTQAGGWFELKKIGSKYYLYGRLRVGGVKKSQYIGRV